MSEQLRAIVEVSNRYRYLRILREVRPTNELEALLAVIGEAAVSLFGDKAAVFKKLSPNGQLPKSQGSNTRIIGIPAVTIYPANRLWLTQFEVLVSPKDVSKHSALKRLDERTEDIMAGVALSGSELTVSSHQMSFAHQSGFENLGQEIVLELKQSADLTVIDEQNKILDGIIRHTGPGNDLSGNFHGPQLSIAVGRLPVYYADQADEFNSKMSQLQTEVQQYLPQPGIELGQMTTFGKVK